MAALTVINTIPTGSAAARQELWISNAGVVMKYSSHAYSIDGIVKSSKKTKETLRALYCRNERTIGGAIVTKVVIRMCSLRRKATTASSIAAKETGWTPARRTRPAGCAAGTLRRHVRTK